jgi:hypothetical protein
MVQTRRTTDGSSRSLRATARALAALAGGLLVVGSAVVACTGVVSVDPHLMEAAISATDPCGPQPAGIPCYFSDGTGGGTGTGTGTGGYVPEQPPVPDGGLYGGTDGNTASGGTGGGTLEGGSTGTGSTGVDGGSTAGGADGSSGGTLEGGGGPGTSTHGHNGHGGGNGNTGGSVDGGTSGGTGEPTGGPSPDGGTVEVPPGGCFVTGIGTLFSGTARQSFGGNGMYMKDGSVRGEWQHVDHSAVSPENRFHGQVTYLTCQKIPGPGPDVPHALPNQAIWGGPGRWNNVDGYTFEVVAVDRQEPGRHHDEYHITIKDSSGAVILDKGDIISGGNFQIHPSNAGHPYSPP